MDEKIIADEKIVAVSLESTESDPTDVVEVETYAEHKNAVSVIDIMTEEAMTVDVGEAFPSLGEPNDALDHSLLVNRESSDQHPITAITGLREELNSIEALQTLYSDVKYQADYYEWEDGNPTMENRLGYFVSVCKNIKTIEICTGEDMFGVTVDSAGFIGNQDDYVPRDHTYGLVVHYGVVNVRCELDVQPGDYVVSNGWGIAEKSKSEYGCKVIGLIEIDGVLHATIPLNIPIDQMDRMGQDNMRINTRLDDVEENLNAAIYTANKAFQMAQQASELSSEASKDASNALGQAGQTDINTSEQLQQMAEQIAKSQELSAQAQSIAINAMNTSKALRDEAVDLANSTLSDLNAAIKDLDPISEWGRDGDYITLDTWNSTGKDINTVYYARDTQLYYYYQDGDWVSVSELGRGASYMYTYMKDDLATRAEVDEVDKRTETNMHATISNAENFQRMISSVDKYSVGEYSQSYGLTWTEAKNILKVGTIYVPTPNRNKCCDTHKDIDPHCEKFINRYYNEELEKTVDEIEVTHIFVPGSYYIWDGTYWQETTGKVLFITDVSQGVPAITGRFWYIDSNEAPPGYEPYGLYEATDVTEVDGNIHKEWQLVSTLGGNVNNRISSMFKQKADEVAMEVVNARGSYASVGARISEDEATVTSIALWAQGDESDFDSPYNLATIQQTANEAGANVAMVAGQICSKYEILKDQDWDDSGKNIEEVYYVEKTKLYWYYKEGDWHSTPYPTEAGLEVNGASIVAAINGQTGETSATINADYINFNGAITANGNFAVDKLGFMYAQGCSIANWIVDSNSIYKEIECSSNPETLYKVLMNAPATGLLSPTEISGTPAFAVVKYTYKTDKNNYQQDLIPPFVVTYDGTLIATKATITGDIIAKSLTLQDGVKIPSGSVDGLSNTIQTEIGNANVITADDVKVGTTTTSNGLTKQTITVGDSSFDIIKSGDFVLLGNSYGTSSSNHSTSYTKISTQGLLEAHNAIIYGTIYASEGDIGDWKIQDKAIRKDTYTYYDVNTETSGYYVYRSEMAAAEMDSNGKGQRVFSIYRKPISYNQYIQETAWSNISNSEEAIFWVNSRGKLYAKSAEIKGKITATEGDFSGSVTIGGTTVTADHLRKLYKGARGNTGDDTIQITRVTATDGTIGGWHLNEANIYWQDENEIERGIVLGHTTVGVTNAKFTAYEKQTNWSNIVGAGYQYGNSDSDRDVKNSIEKLPDQYEVFFDKLMPCRFKYNDRDVDVYHTGFIAQDVLQALNDSTMSTLDLAAYEELGDNYPSGAKYRLQKDEFVALNTWQIQKAKTRIATLENEVATLKEQVAKLIKGE